MSLVDINFISASSLAYVGDSVYSLYVRQYLATNKDSKAGGLHKEAASIVSALKQAEFVDLVINRFSKEELAIFNRCKNVHTNNKPSTCNYEQYKKATGLEGLLGALYLSGQEVRLKEIIDWKLQEI